MKFLILPCAFALQLKKQSGVIEKKDMSGLKQNISVLLNNYEDATSYDGTDSLKNYLKDYHVDDQCFKITEDKVQMKVYKWYAFLKKFVTDTSTRTLVEKKENTWKPSKGFWSSSNIMNKEYKVPAGCKDKINAIQRAPEMLQEEKIQAENEYHDAKTNWDKNPTDDTENIVMESIRNYIKALENLIKVTRNEAYKHKLAALKIQEKDLVTKNIQRRELENKVDAARMEFEKAKKKLNMDPATYEEAITRATNIINALKNLIKVTENEDEKNSLIKQLELTGKMAQEYFATAKKIAQELSQKAKYQSFY